MSTLIGTEASFVDMLIHLVELDFDAISAYQAAIARLDSSSIKQAMHDFLCDHERHIRELSPIIIAAGGKAPVEADLKEVVTKGKVVVGQLLGDAGILSAMSSNEDDTNDAYERASSRIDVRESIRVLLAHCLSDERRHRAWIEAELARLQRAEEPIDSMPQTAI